MQDHPCGTRRIVPLVTNFMIYARDCLGRHDCRVLPYKLSVVPLKEREFPQSGTLN